MASILGYEIKVVKREIWELELVDKKFYIEAEPNETKEQMFERIGLVPKPVTVSFKIENAPVELDHSKYYSVTPHLEPFTPALLHHGMDDVKCPKCGSRARIQGPSRTTLAYYPPIYDESGVNTNPDRNQTSTSWECTSCGEKYETITQNGVVKVNTK